MQAQSNPPADHLAHRPRANALRISAKRLGALAAEDGWHRVIVPKADEEAWEGTEIDVRRTVL